MLILNTINIRIKEIRDKFNLTQEKFAKEIGLSTSNLGQIEINKSNPTANTLYKIVKNFHINGTWILTGDGEMFTDTNQDMLNFSKVVNNNNQVINGSNSNITASEQNNLNIQVVKLREQVEFLLKENSRLKDEIILLLKEQKK